MDPYVYEGSTVLINHLNITDDKELIEVEAQFLIAAILEMDTLLETVDFLSDDSINAVHHYLFSDLYSWAGEYRTINIYKNKPVLNGLSVSYSSASAVSDDIRSLFTWVKEVEWSMDNTELTNAFTSFIVRLWRIHPFREGNTRTVSIFLKLFAEKHGIYFNLELISKHSNYFRNALVLATVEEAPDIQYLSKIIIDALTPAFLSTHPKTTPSLKNYQQVKGYDSSKYEEKPFYTNEDSEND